MNALYKVNMRVRTYVHNHSQTYSEMVGAVEVVVVLLHGSGCVEAVVLATPVFVLVVVLGGDGPSPHGSDDDTAFFVAVVVVVVDPPHGSDPSSES